MRETMTVNPAHLSDDDWARLRAFLDAAKSKGEVVDLSARVELLTPAEVARRLGMSRSTVLRRIADGDLKSTKVGTHHRIPLCDYERYSHELTRKMAEAGRHRSSWETRQLDRVRRRYGTMNPPSTTKFWPVT